MALSKQITNPVGFTTNYHKVTNVELVKSLNYETNYETNETTYTPIYKIKTQVYSYTEKSIRDKAVHLCAESRKFELTAPVEEVETTPILSVVYTKLKETELFENATDC